ncbi:hypothetical protein SAMN04489731_12819 [Amycolatopsis regifaucium]|nr:hypothetical protein SAMN04489731_12819 [Amycolatopsis regifaucium]
MHTTTSVGQPNDGDEAKRAAYYQAELTIAAIILWLR